MLLFFKLFGKLKIFQSKMLRGNTIKFVEKKIRQRGWKSLRARMWIEDRRLLRTELWGSTIG